MEKFREVLETEYLQRKLVDCPSPEADRPDRRPHRRARAEGRQVLHRRRAGRRPDQRQHPDRPRRPRREVRRCRRPADRAPEARRARRGRGRRRAASSPTWPAIDLEARPSNWRRSTMACTGIEFCKLAIVETKQRAIDLVTELEQRFPDLDTPITINVNGCPNACARTQVADIGLKGMLVLDDDGNQVEGFQVHLGGALGLHDELRQEAARPQGHQRRPRRLRHHGRRQLPRTTARTARRFAAWVARADEDPAARREGTSEWPAERPRGPVPLPLLRRREPVAARGRRGLAGHGEWECRSCLRAFKLNMIGQLRPPASATLAQGGTSDDRPHHAGRPRSTRLRDRGPQHRRAPRDRLPRRRRARARARRGHHRVGRGHLRRPVLRHLVDERRRALAPRLQGGARDRRGVPRHRLPLRRDDRHPRRGRGDACRST